MKPDGVSLRARDYVAGLATRGRQLFSAADARAALGGTAAAVKLALGRLAKHGEIASPARGYYIIVPPEYRALGSLPADQFIPALMERLGLAYYAGLLTAAQYHGAAHHRPQEFQVMLERPRRPLVCGVVRVAFLVRKRLADVPVQALNTPRGTVAISTPEATAVDLVGYHERAGGLDNVATVLAELAERLDPDALLIAAQTAPVTWAQRLGHLLDRVGAEDRATALRPYVGAHARETVPLLPSAPRAASVRDATWKLYVNAEVEAEA